MTPDPSHNQVDLALQRTELALERTQLAWVRTAFVLITAGLTLDKGFSALADARLLQGKDWVISGKIGGVLLAVSAAVLLIIATISYIKRAKVLRSFGESQFEQLLPILSLSTLVVFLGVTVAILLVVLG